MGRATTNFSPALWGPEEGSNQISLNFNYKVFLNQTLYVFSEIKGIKHFEWNFHLVALVMPLGWDLAGCWGLKVFLFSKNGNVAYHMKGDYE